MWAGVLFRLDPGWHIYWQNPGDSGTPPKIEWHLPASYRAGAVQWPTPKRLGSGSVIDYGYEKQVLLMAPVTRAPGAATMSSASYSISADVRYVVCSEICIPGKAHVTLATGASGDPPAGAARWHALFQQTRAQLPKPAPASWSVSAKQDKSHFMLRVRGVPEVKVASFLPLEPDEIENSAGEIFMGAQDGFGLTLKKSEQLVKPITILRGLIVVGPERAFEIAAPVQQ
jgi:DsbC/DsbD-like thiol-disulfide interchange protein